MKILKMQLMQTEFRHFRLERPDTRDEYIFCYFHTPVTVWLDEKPISTRPGAWILWDKHSYQKFYCKGEVLHDWFHLSGNLDELMQERGLSYNTVYYADKTAPIHVILQQMEIEWLLQDRYSSEVIDGLIEVLFWRLARQTEPSVLSLDENMLSQLLSVRTRVHSQLARDWTVKDMADMIALSPAQFYRLYRLAFGISPKADLINDRIESSKQLLLYRRDSIAKVAEAVGFSNEFHFIRMFKAHNGVTPAKYRAEWLLRAEDQPEE